MDPFLGGAAAFVILLVLGKIGFLYADARSYFRFARRLYTHPKALMYGALGCAALLLWGLLASGVGVIEILAVTLFVACLQAASLAPLARHIVEAIEREGIENLLAREYAVLLAWIALAGWGAAAVLGGLAG